MLRYVFLPLGSLLSAVLPTAGPTPPPAAATCSFTITNKLAQARPAETISLPAARLPAVGTGHLEVHDQQTGAVLASQPLDLDGDGKPEELLFQADFGARATRRFTVAVAPGAAPATPAGSPATFSRFVPERIDDYAWENDRVAFRTYGPVAQQLTEAGRKDGTLTSGMDCWLKRVPYPIIDKWYGGYPADHRYYHVDRGEGYDPYHVGASRGCGGTGVWDQDRLLVSKNFVRYRLLATGPIRTVFELTYAPWEANGRVVTEKKRISLDLGSQLTRYEEILTSSAPLPNFVIGITLHDQKGTVAADKAAGWFRHWETIDDAQLGTGLVLDPRRVTEYRDYRTDQTDQSHLLVFTKPEPENLVFYAGFAWTKAGRIQTVQDWEAYLADFARRLASPLPVCWAK
ncbi:DUF4861 family protein [Hymenobacter rubripertinctus]|uniref:DUF4861 domain-containing protein n=1 Tax=Hymenobacter rubripertinctus TaxID=2029981 RepID=A0A418RAF5_9BACT|nr:DUF4861 family protein [Hymenobacter rubripertinctus]RIY14262.1 DUF4861 domain-containing protein [Hymenobacter rubripertinctus]